MDKTKRTAEAGRTDCVGVICFRGDEVLLIRRGKPPRAGEWSLPGGRIEPGESERDAALRELREETGCSAMLGNKIAVINADFEGFAYRLHEYIATWTSGEPEGADDALEARFWDMDEISALRMWPKTEQVIRDAHSVIRSGEDCSPTLASEA
ncbi:MAG: NUDIX hydrolase [Litorimonas sp.]